jgi:hypothetical protein
LWFASFRRFFTRAEDEECDPSEKDENSMESANRVSSRTAMLQSGPRLRVDLRIDGARPRAADGPLVRSLWVRPRREPTKSRPSGRARRRRLGSRGQGLCWRAADADDKEAIKGTRFALQENPWNLTDAEQGKLTDVQKTNRPLHCVDGAIATAALPQGRTHHQEVHRGVHRGNEGIVATSPGAP